MKEQKEEYVPGREVDENCEQAKLNRKQLVRDTIKKIIDSNEEGLRELSKD